VLRHSPGLDRTPLAPVARTQPPAVSLHPRPALSAKVTPAGPDFPDRLRWFLASIFIVLMSAFAPTTWTLAAHHGPSHALLSSTSGGHSLFTPPPFAEYHGVIFPGPAQQAWPRPLFPDSVPTDPDNPSDRTASRDPTPYEVGNPTCAPLMCYTQLTPVSAFTGGQAVKAIAEILPPGYTEPINVSVGIDTHSDVNLAAREVLTTVTSTLSPPILYTALAVSSPFRS
jgi:hypothetical protein